MAPNGSSLRSSAAVSVGIAAQCWIAAAVLLAFAARLPAGHGFEELRFAAVDGACGPPPPTASTAIVRAPVLAGVRGASCRRLRSRLALPHPARYQLMVDSAAGYVLSIDGRELGRHARSASIEYRWYQTELDAGEHALELALTDALRETDSVRLHSLDLNGPWPWGMEALRWEDWRVGAPSTAWPRHWLSALAFCVLVILGTALAWDAAAPRARAHIIDALVITTAVALYLIPYALSVGVLTDELAYVKGGEHYITNLLVGDLSASSFRSNAEHPPIARWLFGVGWLLGGLSGARMVAVTCASLSVGLLAVATSILFGRVQGWVAALLVCSAPHVLALSRICTLESVVLFFWSALLVVIASWVAHATGGSGPPPGRRGSLREHGLAFAAAVICVLGTTSRATFVWAGVPMLGLLVHVGGARRKGGLWLPWLGMLFGALTGGAIAFAGWPFLWPAPYEPLQVSVEHFLRYTAAEHYRGELRVPLPREYFAHAFVATTPELLMAMGVLGAIVGRPRGTTLLIVLATLAPFGQSLSHIRQDLARYVVNAWPGLAVLAAVAVAWLGERIGTFARGRGVTWLTKDRAAVLVALAVASQGLIGLRDAEPYPRLYFAAWTGGAAEVARTRLFEIADWCEGMEDPIAYLNGAAGPGERVLIDTPCGCLAPELRSDLERVESGARAWVVTHVFMYRPASPGSGCSVAHETRAAGVAIATVWDCRSR